MNQILDYNPNKSSGGGSSGSDKVVRVFAIILICFAICLVVAGGYNIINNKTEEKPVVTQTQAKVEAEQKETTILIKVSHDKAIEKLIYSWDSDKETTLKGTGEATMETEIPLLAGTHTLNVKVTDVEGVETLFEKEFYSETGEDKISPIIDLDITDDKKLKITATDETAINYVTYRWNNDEEIQVDVSEEDNKKIEFEIDINKGKNDIVIIAVDANNNTTNTTKSFTGVMEPNIKVTVSADKKTVDILCYHENGIKEVGLKINDLTYNVDLQGQTPIEVPLPGIALAEGENKIYVSAKSVDDTFKEIEEQVTSTPDEDEINLSINDEGTITINIPNGIKEIKLNLNDVDYDVAVGDTNPTDITIDKTSLPLTDGNNKITVKVISVNGTEKEEVKEIQYTAE